MVSVFAGVCGQSGYADGSGSSVRFTSPYGLIFDSSNLNLIATEASSNALRYITLSGVVSSVVPRNILMGAASSVSVPVIGTNGTLFVSSSDNHCIRNLVLPSSFTGSSFTAGVAWRRYSHTLGLSSVPVNFDALNALFQGATYVSKGVTTSVNSFGFNTDQYAVDLTGYFYVTSAGSYTFGISVDDVEDFFINGQPVAVRYSSWGSTTGNAVSLQSGYHRLYARLSESIGSDYVILNVGGAVIPANALFNLAEDQSSVDNNHQFAGFCGVSGNANATGTSARFNFPTDMVYISKSDILLVADSGNHCIRSLNFSRLVSVFSGTCGVSGNSSSLFNSPRGLAYDLGLKLVYLVDSGNHCIRKITESGTVSAFAGSCGTAGNITGSATSARFNSPREVAIDQSTGDLFVADTGNHCIRQISLDCPDGTEFNSNRTACIACSRGKYRLLSGSSRSCIDCQSLVRWDTISTLIRSASETILFSPCNNCRLLLRAAQP